jgi:hypothetical protein
MAVVVPANVVGAYRALRDLGPARPRPEPADEHDTFRHIGDITHECLVGMMTGIIERWRSGNHG